VPIAEPESHLQKVALFGSERVTNDNAVINVRIWPGLSLGARFF
jgi:hypothetical protein